MRELVKFRLLGFFLLIPLIVALAICDRNPPPEKVRIYTGNPTGTYYPLGVGLADILNNRAAGLAAEVLESQGSVENASKIGTGEAQLAFIQNDIAFFAHQGTEMFTGSRVENLRGVASLYISAIHFVTLKDSGIRTIEDLKGRSVAVGAAGSGTRIEALAILNAAGLDAQNTDIRELDFQNITDSLLDGTLDAGCITAGFPAEAVSEIGAGGNLNIIEIPDVVLAKLPYLVRQVLPAGTYSGLDRDIATAAVLGLLTTSAGLSTATVYTITQALFENLDCLAAAHPRGADIRLSTALRNMTVPLHPGAEKYYREQGLLQ